MEALVEALRTTTHETSQDDEVKESGGSSEGELEGETGGERVVPVSDGEGVGAPKPPPHPEETASGEEEREEEKAPLESEQEVDPELGPPQEGDGEIILTGEQAVRFLERAHQLDSIVRGSFYVSGYVSKEPAEILLDNGSEVTAISPTLLKQIPLSQRPKLRKCRISSHGVSQTPLGILGAVEVEVDIGGEKGRIDAVVMKELDKGGIDFLLGNDFTDIYDFYLRGAKRFCAWGVPDLKVPIYKTKGAHTRGRMVLARDVIIQPAYRAQVEIELEGHPDISNGACMFMEELPTWKNNFPQVRVRRGVVDLRRGPWIVEMENLGSEAVQLTGGELVSLLVPVAKVEEYQQTQTSEENTVRLIKATIQRIESEAVAHEVGKEDTDPSTVIGESKEGQEEVNDGDRSTFLEGLKARLPDHMRTLMEGLAPTLSETEVLMIVELLQEYEDVFQSPDEPLGRTDVVKHTIDVQGHAPIKQAPRRLPYHKQEIVKEELKKMLDQNLIRPSDSPWASPIVLVTKKDGTTRFCIDYRKLNEVTRKDAFPLPRIDESLDTLAGAKYFCTLDLASGYWQVEMAEEDREKTAFCTKFGLFEFNVMPFGLCNAPATFEKLTERALADMQWEECLVYIDDVIIFGRTFLEVLQRLGKVLERFRQYQLKIKAKKCDLFRKIVEFLGHLVSEDGIRCDPKKIDKISKWPTPKNVSEVRSFLGIAGYYRKFIENFSTLAGPLVELTQKDVPFHWGETQEFSMRELQRCLTSAPVLAYPDVNGTFLLDTDASGTGVGGVLSQIQADGEEKPVAYASFTLNKSQRRYCTTKRELLAMVLMIEHFRPYLLGRHFTVRTDHSSLLWLKAFKDPEGILGRWLTRLQLYHFTIEYREGRRHINADTMSRLGHSLTTCKESPRLCKFAKCEECSPRRTTKEQLENIKVTQEDLDKFFMRAVQTRSRTSTGPRRSKRLAKQRGKVKAVTPVKQRLQRRARGERNRKLNKRAGRSLKRSRGTPDVEDPEQNVELSRHGPEETPAAEERDLEEYTEEEKADSPLPIIEWAEDQSDEEEEKVETTPEVDRTSSPEDPSDPQERRYQLRPRNTAQPPEAGGVDSPVVESTSNPEQDQENTVASQETDGERGRPEREERSNWLDLWTNQELAEMQDSDSQCKEVRSWLKNRTRPKVQDLKGADRLKRALWAQWDQLVLRDGVMYRRWYPEGALDPCWQTVVPHNLRRKIFRALHAGNLTGHLGMARTVENVKTSFYWPGYKEQVKLWVKQCKVCNQNLGKPRKIHRAGLTQRGSAGPFEVVAFDILQLVTTSSGNRYLLVICDQFTKWVEAIPLPRHDAKTVAVTFVQEWVCRYGTPRQLHSDRGKDLTGQVMTEIYKLLQIDKTATTAFRPQSNGQVERMNRSICKMLRAFIQEWQHQDWDTMVPMIMSAYRRSVHESTKFTPNRMVFGRECNLPVHLMYGVPEKYPVCPVAFVQDISERLQNMHELARDSIKCAANKQKRNYDRYTGQRRRFYVGDQVNFYNAPKDQKVTSRPWEHYVVTKVWDEDNPVLYTISKGRRCKSRQVHIDNLLPYYGTDDIEPWWEKATNTKGTQVCEEQLPTEVYEVTEREEEAYEKEEVVEEDSDSDGSEEEETPLCGRVETGQTLLNLTFKEGDLFTSPPNVSLAHCISADAAMLGGIAAQFKRRFRGVQEILSQKARPGEMAVLTRGDRYIYYLVTKKNVWDLPELPMLRRSLEAMKAHCKKNDVVELAMPKIGCGIDQLRWEDVEKVVRDVFVDVKINITIYSLPTPPAEEKSSLGETVETPRWAPKLQMIMKEGDLFQCPPDESLAHCISADVSMSMGIAVIFKNKFGGVKEIEQQDVDVGGVAVLERDGRYIYYLVTKSRYWDRPTYKSLQDSLQSMKKRCIRDQVKKLSMPCIGCGLDGLDWDLVRSLIHSVFFDVDMRITIYAQPRKKLQGVRFIEFNHLPAEDLQDSILWDNNPDTWGEINKWREKCLEVVNFTRERLEKCEGELFDSLRGDELDPTLIGRVDARQREFKGACILQQEAEDAIQREIKDLENNYREWCANVVEEVLLEVQWGLEETD